MTPDKKRFSQWISGLRLNIKPVQNRFKVIKRSFYSRWLPRSLPRLRLSHQLIGFFVLVVLVPLLLLSFSIYSINQKAVRKQVAQFIEHTAEATYDEFRLEMRWQQEQSELASQYWLALKEHKNPKHQAQKVSSFFESYPNYEAVAFYDKQGTLQEAILSPNALYPAIQFPDSRAPLPEQLEFKLAYHSKVAKAPEMNYSLQAVVPVTDTDSRYGSIVFLKRFPYLGMMLSERLKTFHHGFVIVDENGVIIAGPSKLVSQRLPKQDLYLYQSLQEGVLKEFSSKTPTYSKAPINDDDHDDPELEKVFIKVPNLGWGLIMESPYSIQRQYINIARSQSVGLVILCNLLIVVLGLLYSRGINRNFRQLIKGIKALAEGRYSRKIRLITKSWTPFEIVYLSAEFNRMATKISTAWSSIQKLNQELVYKNQQDLFIAQATQRLHSTLELSQVCETATRILSERPEILETLLFLQTDNGKFELAACSANCEEFPLNEAELAHLHEGSFANALRNHRPIRLTQHELPCLPDETQAKIQPVYYQENPLGVIFLLRSLNPDHQAVIYDSALVIDLISSQIGVAIHQARQWEQLQRANIQLAKLDDLKSNLIDTVSHELRTPLTNIKGYTSRLIRYDDTLDCETKIKSLKVIKQQADRLGRLVEDLLVIPDLEREEGIRVFPDRVSLTELINRSVAFIHEKANREIHVQSWAEELEILVDPDRMEQVILNLLDNAIKYSYENSAIEVLIQQSSPQMAHIIVFNHCDPIHPDELATLFAKFKRLDERTTRTTRGTGLGLFITKGLIEAMGGNISLNGNDGFRVNVEVPLFRVKTMAEDSETRIVEAL